ncbi:MAG: DUF3108 domain-containing protein, partial [Thiotrichales bacterium]|nr:DUF3108 domain-containing protein [Thiotrichales bacterium]
SKTTGLIAFFYKRSIRETTAWEYAGDRFIPQEYHYTREKKDKVRTVNITFDWDRQRISTRVNDSSWNMPLESPVYDKLLYQVAIMHDLARGTPIDVYRIADGGRLKEYSFTQTGHEVIATPLGELETIRLIRHKENQKDKAVLWCAPGLHYLPVRVDTYEDDGSVITALLTQLEGME